MNGENRYQKINEFFNSDYQWWENVYDHRLPKGFFSFEMIQRKEILLKMVKDMVKEKTSVAILECGCGPGGILGEIHSSGQLLVGVDINFSYLAKAQKDCNAKGTLLQADIERLPFHDNSFDIAYCVGVLSYLEEDRNAIKEICRVMKPGGKVIVSVPNLFTFNKIFDPYYYLVGLVLMLWNKSMKTFSPDASSGKRYKVGMIRRYHYGQLDCLYREFGLLKKETCSVSFGPPTLWRKELLPLGHTIRMSEALVRLSSCRKFGFLTRLANHWVTSLEKTPVVTKEGT